MEEIILSDMLYCTKYTSIMCLPGIYVCTYVRMYVCMYVFMYGGRNACMFCLKSFHPAIQLYVVLNVSGASCHFEVFRYLIRVLCCLCWGASGFCAAGNKYIEVRLIYSVCAGSIHTYVDLYSAGIYSRIASIALHVHTYQVLIFCMLKSIF